MGDFFPIKYTIMCSFLLIEYCERYSIFESPEKVTERVPFAVLESSGAVALKQWMPQYPMNSIEGGRIIDFRLIK